MLIRPTVDITSIVFDFYSSERYYENRIKFTWLGSKEVKVEKKKQVIRTYSEYVENPSISNEIFKVNKKWSKIYYPANKDVPPKYPIDIIEDPTFYYIHITMKTGIVLQWVFDNHEDWDKSFDRLVEFANEN